jgi:hypothetical protein
MDSLNIFLRNYIILEFFLSELSYQAPDALNTLSTAVY